MRKAASTLLLLVAGLMIHAFAHAGLDLIGEGVMRSKSRDYPVFCHIEITRAGEDETQSCSGTLVSETEVVSGGHCFKKNFNLDSGSVTVWCGDKSFGVKAVTLPDSAYWRTDDIPFPGFDYAKLTVSGKKVSATLPKATQADRYFDLDTGEIQKGVRCWLAGFGKNPSGGVGALYRVEVSDQKLQLGGGVISMKDPQGGYLKVSADHGDSGGSFYCQAPGQSAELVGVIVSYLHEKRRDSRRMENHFAPVWQQQ